MPSPSVLKIFILLHDLILLSFKIFSMAVSEPVLFCIFATHTFFDATSKNICRYLYPSLVLVYGPCISVIMYSPGFKSVFLFVVVVLWFPECIFVDLFFCISLIFLFLGVLTCYAIYLCLTYLLLHRI